VIGEVVGEQRVGEEKLLNDSAELRGTASGG
jgi:hypothetical protein